jgi:hypothetical protein
MRNVLIKSVWIADTVARRGHLLEGLRIPLVPLRRVVIRQLDSASGGSSFQLPVGVIQEEFQVRAPRQRHHFLRRERAHLSPRGVVL